MAQPKRAGIMPDLPTMDEAGMPGFDVGIWIGLLAPAGTPAAIVDKLSKAANDALKTEPVMKAMTTQGIDALGGNAEGIRAISSAPISTNGLHCQRRRPSRNRPQHFGTKIVPLTD